MIPTDRILPLHIRKVEFEYNGAEDSFTQFLACLAHEYLKQEECAQTGYNSMQTVEFPAKP